MNHKYNLNTRKITEFTTEDTIYIQDKDDNRGLVFLCQFLSYDGNKREVTGKVIGVDDPKEDFKIGKVLVNKLHRCCLYGNSTDKVNRPYYRFFDSSLYAMHPLHPL